MMYILSLISLYFMFNIATGQSMWELMPSNRKNTYSSLSEQGKSEAIGQTNGFWGRFMQHTSDDKNKNSSKDTVKQKAKKISAFPSVKPRQVLKNEKEILPDSLRSLHTIYTDYSDYDDDDYSDYENEPEIFSVDTTNVDSVLRAHQ